MGRRSFRTLTLMAVGSVALALPTGSAGAVEGSFSATGAASGVLMQFTVPGAPLQDTVIDAGGPTARVLLDSLGASRGYASFPFPGEIPAAGPGLVRGLTNIPVPDYPLFVASFHPSTPKSRFSGGGTELNSESDADSSRSTAETAGMASSADAEQGFGIARSQASAVRTAETVESVATSELTGVRIGPLTIGQVQSVARVVVDDSGQRLRTSELRIIGAEVDGQAVSVTGEGVVAQGQPVPGTTPAPLQQALEGSGFDLVVSAPTRTATGITAPALQVTRTFDTGETVTATLAMASAAIESSGAVDADTAGAGTPSAGGATPAGDEPTTPAPAAAPPAPEGSSQETPPPLASEATEPDVMTDTEDALPAPRPESEPLSGLLNEVGVGLTTTSGAAPAGGRSVETAAPVTPQAPVAVPHRSEPAAAGNLAMAPLAHELVHRTTSTPAAFGVLLAGGVGSVGIVAALIRKPKEARD